MHDTILNKAHEYVKALRAECNAAEKRGEQIDFWDAFAITRPTGENAVYWLLPELRKVQAERDALLAIIEALVASPVVNGVQAGIRDNAKARGAPDPFAAALAALARGAA